MKQLFILLILSIALGSSVGGPASEVKEVEVKDLGSEPMDSKIPKAEMMAVSTCSCLESLYIMAFTSDKKYAGSDGEQSVEVQLRNGHTQSKILYDRPGNDMLENKGDLWKIKFSSFGFSDSCITLQDIKNVAITASSTDGWNIESIATFIEDNAGEIQVLTQDFNAYRWIDKDGEPSHKRFDLTLA